MMVLERSMLTVRLTKLSNKHHRFAYQRSDGSGQHLDLETRNFLLHDLIHFAVESEGRFKNSFYALLARGETYESLGDADMTDASHPGGDEILMTERIVGAFTGLAKGLATPAQVLDGIRNLLEAHEEPMPAWLTLDFAEHVAERLRQLQGRWKATPFGATLELQFDVD
jgi:hypothetical protein